MAAFKREARWRQHRWAVEQLGITHFGTHQGRGSALEVPNGTKLLDADGARGANFLTPEIHQVAARRAASRQPHEMLDRRRLDRDLLSSMPMAFNLFAEASLTEHEGSRRRLAELFGLVTSKPTEILFEWSPARRSAKYTRDRTAFDVALCLGESRPRTVVGIETKYHEHSEKEAKPKPEARSRHEDQTRFLATIAEKSGVFRAGWQDAVIDTDLRQIWRDHLLALSMRMHPSEWTADTRHVLLYPSRNTSFRDAAHRYRNVLSDHTTFLALTIEEVVDAAFDHGGARARFEDRYLGWL